MMLLLLAMPPQGAADFGWFAYAPLSGARSRVGRVRPGVRGGWAEVRGGCGWR
ncbi:protein of unknown function [Streptantibioticus cattleyicolor NRRL 8057 = DSM 46488]|nr:protein of unknown function [Streptantibioticus cattleyicolor NRRL 8057 = DSM 46488]